MLYLSQHADHDPLVTVGRCMAEAPGDERHCAELVLERWFQKGPGPSEVQALLVGATTARMQVGYWAGRAAACLASPSFAPAAPRSGRAARTASWTSRSSRAAARRTEPPSGSPGWATGPPGA